jgi:hypothetical protein
MGECGQLSILGCICQAGVLVCIGHMRMYWHCRRQEYMRNTLEHFDPKVFCVLAGSFQGRVIVPATYCVGSIKTLQPLGGSQE